MQKLERRLEERVRELDEVIRRANKSLQKAPEGSLVIFHAGGRRQCYQSLGTDPETGKKKRRYLRKEEEPLIRRLAQKDYDMRVLKAAGEERAFLVKMGRKYPGEKAEMVYGEMDEARRDMVIPLFLSDEELIRRWLSRHYEPKEFRQGDIVYYTDKGERVRSKSEVIIANMLNAAGIPYLYEFPLKLEDGVTLYPDFTVLNVKKRKTMIWEHLGMMDNAEYARKALDRILMLERNGYFPGEQLILTHETSEKPLDIRLVKNMIQRYLI